MRRAMKSQWVSMSSLQISSHHEACTLGRMATREELLLLTIDVKPSVVLMPRGSYSVGQPHFHHHLQL